MKFEFSKVHQTLALSPFSTDGAKPLRCYKSNPALGFCQ
jgi:hypothetical protein